MYDKLQKEHIFCKVNHCNEIFFAQHFLDFFDLLQTFVYTFDITIGLDFPIAVVDLHSKLDLSWRACPHCNKIVFLE